MFIYVYGRDTQRNIMKWFLGKAFVAHGLVLCVHVLVSVLQVKETGRRERKGCFLLGQLHGEAWYWVQCRRKTK